jgi:hypothetical protein
MGYLTVERSLRLTSTRSTFGSMQSVISTTGLCSRKSALRMSCHPITGRYNRKPPYFLGNLNSAILFLTLRPRASREDVTAPVSMRAGSHTPHDIRITSSTSPIVIFSLALANSATRRRIAIAKSSNRFADRDIGYTRDRVWSFKIFHLINLLTISGRNQCMCPKTAYGKLV